MDFFVLFVDDVVGKCRLFIFDEILLASRVSPCKHFLADFSVSRGFIFVDFVIRDVTFVELIIILRPANAKLICAGASIEGVLGGATVTWLEFGHADVCK